MKWFKADTDGYRSEGVLAIKAEMGFEGFGWWYQLLQMVAEKMDETDRCHLELPVKEWCKAFDTKPQKFIKFVILTVQNCKTVAEVRFQNDRTSSSEWENILLRMGAEREQNGVTYIRISIPKLLEKRDNHTSNLQATSKKLVSKKEKEMSAIADISKKKKETTGVVSKSEDARETPTPVQTAHSNPKSNGKHPPDKFLEQAQEFIERVQNYIPLNQNDISGIRFDLNLHGRPDQLSFILDQLQAAKTDGRLNASPGIANPVGWIRKQIQEETKSRDAAAVT